MKKIIQKLFSAFGVAALAMVFTIVGTVFAATNWSTWTVDMTKTAGDALTSSSWNKMVAAIEENNTAVMAAQATANTALANAAVAQTTAFSSNEMPLGNGLSSVICGWWGNSDGTNKASYFYIDRVNKKVYVKGNNETYALGNNSATAYFSSKTENTYLSALFSVGDLEGIYCGVPGSYGNAYNAYAVVKTSGGATKVYAWGLLYYSGTGYNLSPFFNSTTGLINYSGSNWGYLVPTEITTSNF